MFSIEEKMDDPSFDSLFDGPPAEFHLEHPLVMKFKENLTRLGIKSGDRLLVGFSGGPDSTLLLYLISKLRRGLNLILYALYVDHGIRSKEEIEKEIEFVKNSYRRFGVEGFVERIAHGEITQIAKKSGKSVEEVAREKRYRIFYRYVSNLNVNHLLLGHNLDDNVETIIMRFLYGNGLKGLAGIPESNGIIKRPLFSFSKSEILSYLREKRLDFSVDSTNEKSDYLRNIVRNKLIPQIENYIPDIKIRMSSISRRARLLRDFFYWNFERSLKGGHIEIIKDGFRIDGAWFINLHPLLRVELFYSLLNWINNKGEDQVGSVESLPYRFLGPLLNIEQLQSRRVVLDGYGMKLEWVGCDLFWRRNIVDNAKKGYLIKLRNSDLYSIKLLDKRIGIERIEIREIDEPITNKRRAIVVEVSKEETNAVIVTGCFRPPLFIRSRREGDRVVTSKGRKSLKKLFVEMGVRGDIRDRVPLLCDRDGIAVVLGSSLGYDDRIRRNWGVAKDSSIFEIKLKLTEKG